MLSIQIEPTPEMYDAPINGVQVPVRVWKGYTQGGVQIEAYVLSIVPHDDEAVRALMAELPSFMRPSRELYAIDLTMARSISPPVIVVDK